MLDNAGFSKNVAVYEERDNKIILLPTIYKNIALYGYPGKKSGLEVDEISKIKIQDSPGLFKILMLHTTLRDAVGNLPIKAVEHEKLPKVDYLALSHLHIKYNKENRVYSGPIFPNNISELEELKGGSFYIFDNGIIKREEIKIKDVITLNLTIKDALNATELIISELKKLSLHDKIVILRLHGILEKGKTTDIEFPKIESFIRENKAFSFLKSTSKLLVAEPEVQLEEIDSEDLESRIISRFEENNPSKFNSLIPHFIRVLQNEKQEDEKSLVFEERLILEINKVLQYGNKEIKY